MQRGSSRLFRENYSSARAPTVIRVRSATARVRKPLIIDGVLGKFEKICKPESSKLNVLRNKQPFSTKQEIDNYINEQIHEAERDIAAKKIQDFWHERKKNRKKKRPLLHDIVIKLSMPRDQLLKYLHKWKDYTDDCIVRRKSPTVDNALFYREKFGALFWTFHVLKRNAILKRSPRLLFLEYKRFYIPEWSFYKMNVEKERKLEVKTNMKRRRILINRVLEALNNYAVSRKFIKSEEEIQCDINFYYMKKVVKALKCKVLIGKVNKKRLRRVCFKWYSYIDKCKMLKASKAMFMQREELKLLKRGFDSFKSFSLFHGIRDSFIFESIQNNKSKMLPYAYLLNGDYNNFLFTSAFLFWVKFLKKKKSAHKFVTFVLNESKKKTFKRFAFDCLRAYSLDKYTSCRYTPFKWDGFKQPTNKVEKRSMFFSLTQQVDKFELEVYTSNSTDTKLFKEYNCEPSPSIEKMSSDDIKTIFYHLVVLFSIAKSKKAVCLNDEVKYWLMHKNIKTAADIINLKRYQACVAKHEFKANQLRTSRNKLIRVTHAAHDSASKLSITVPKFSTSKLEERPEEKPILPKKVQPNEVVPYININANMSSEEHPFLMPIEKISEEIRNNQRMYRRAPNEAFPTVTDAELKGTQSLIESTSSVNLFSRESSYYQSSKGFFTAEMQKINGKRSIFSEIGGTSHKKSKKSQRSKSIAVTNFEDFYSSDDSFSSQSSQRKKNHTNSSMLQPSNSIFLSSVSSSDSISRDEPILTGSCSFVSPIYDDIPDENVLSEPFIFQPPPDVSDSPFLTQKDLDPTLSLIEELSSLAIGYSAMKIDLPASDRITFLTKKCIITLDFLTKKKVSKINTLNSAIKRILKFMTGTKTKRIPKLESRKALYRDSLLHELIERDSCAGNTPNFFKDVLLCIGQMSSLMEAMPEEEYKENDFPAEEFTSFAKKHVMELASKKKKAYSLKSKMEKEELPPTEYDVRFFCFVSRFFLHPSLISRIMAL